jgi:hypothetical protein
MHRGCSRDICINIHCKNNPNFLYKDNSEDELKQASDKLWKEFKLENKHKLSDICCHVDFMHKITDSVQSSTMEGRVSDLEFISSFVMSPYSFSLSFLRDPTIIGKNDEFGQNKYNLNLDEQAVLTFYQKLSSNKSLLLELGEKVFQIEDTESE